MESINFKKPTNPDIEPEPCKSSILEELTNQHYETVQKLYSASRILTKCVNNLGGGAINYPDDYSIETNNDNHISVYVSLIDATNGLLNVIMTNLTKLEQFTDR